MAFKDLLDKGLGMIQSGVKAVGDAAKEKKASMQEFDILKTRSDRLGPLSPYQEFNADPQDGKEQSILNSCLTINVEKAKVINKIIPIDETVIDVKSGKESQTEIEYSLVATDKRLWLVNKNEYMILEYDSIKDCEVINKGIMTQGVKFDDKAFVLDGNETDIKRFFDILKNPEFRRDVISHKISYLMGVIPKRQVINMNMRGITVGDNGAVVLHNGTENKVVNVKDIVSVQLLVNDTAALIRGKTDSSSFMSSPMEARKMAVKVILGMGDYTIETMPQNMMNTSYKREDGTYINNYNFSKKVVDTLGELIKEQVSSGNITGNGNANNMVQGTLESQPAVNSSIPTFDPFANR